MLLLGSIFLYPLLSYLTHTVTKGLHILMLSGVPICDNESPSDTLFHINNFLILQQTLSSNFKVLPSIEDLI